MQANAGLTIVDILSRNPEPLPEWLASNSPPTFDRKTFFTSRTVYYPGSGTDDLAVIEDYGFGGNFDRFGKGGLLERIARKCSVRPEFLLVGKPSEPWTGYENTGASPEPGGMWARSRHLFRRVGGTAVPHGVFQEGD